MDLLTQLQARILELTVKIDAMETKLAEADCSDKDRRIYSKTIRELRETLHSNKILVGTVLPDVTQTLH